MDKIFISKEYLEEEYVIKNKSSGQIAQELGYSTSTIMRFVNEYGIKKGFPLDGLTKEKVIELYLEKNLSCLIIADMYGVAPTSIHDKIIKCGIKIKPKGHMTDAKLAGDESRRNGVGDLSASYWAVVKHGARKRNFDVTVTMKYCWQLFLKQDKKCSLTGRLIKLVRIYKHINSGVEEQTASLDRIDSKKGYVEGNVQWIHKDLNRMKQHYSQEYFIDTCKEVASHQESKVA